MNAFVAWRMLTHEKGRNTLAVGGILVAVLMIFLQLGFYDCVPKAGMLVYNGLRFDILLTSSSYVSQVQSYDFPRARLYQSLSLPEVESASPFYQGEASWLTEPGGIRRDLFVMGFRLADRSMRVDDIERQLDVLQRPDTLLVDTQTLPVYGPKTPGRKVELRERAVEIGGQYALGTGFLGLGAVVVSDVNFIRIFPRRSLAAANLGLLNLRPGSNPDQVAARLRTLLPADTRVFTRPQIQTHEIAYWQTKAPTGIIFGFGVIISIIAGTIILYGTLATQVTRQLPQYATLKAMGYSNGSLRWIVVALALITAGVAYVPSLGVSLIIYERLRIIARLPIDMTVTRLLGVLAITLVMAAGSALLAVGKATRADPADLF
jgi:putative ABC transport system permease protein